MFTTILSVQHYAAVIFPATVLHDRSSYHWVQYDITGLNDTVAFRHGIAQSYEELTGSWLIYP